MGQVYDVIIAHLNSENMHFSANAGEQRISFPVHGRNGAANVQLRVDERKSVMHMLLRLGVHCPVERRDTLCDLLNRINWKLSLGNFEMDMEDGEIGFRASQAYDETVVSQKLVGHVLGCMFWSYDTHLPLLMRVMWSTEADCESAWNAWLKEREKEQQGSSRINGKGTGNGRRNGQSSGSESDRAGNGKSMPGRSILGAPPLEEDPELVALRKELDSLLQADSDPPPAGRSPSNGSSETADVVSMPDNQAGATADDEDEQ